MMVVVKCAPFWCWAAPASTGDRPRFSSKKEGQFWASLLPSHLLPQVVISTKFIEKMACPRNSLTCFFPWAKIAYNTFHLFSFNLNQGYITRGKSRWNFLFSLHCKSNLFWLFHLPDKDTLRRKMRTTAQVFKTK